jgi:tRNA threonylcarbamoyladenosine biosynthesis protein TsaB
VILAFDTATRATAVALGELELRDDPPPGARPRHTTRLVPLICQAMARSGAGWENIELIAVGVGPGTFTGLRVGVATARALARARGLPLVGVSTLQSLAGNAVPVPADGVLAVLDARRGEVFAAAWSSAGGEPRPVLSARAISPEALAGLIPGLGARVLAIGEGAVEFRAVLERSGALIPDDYSELHRVAAKSHIRLAHSLPPSDPDEVRPEYLRLPDAELARRASEPQGR